MNLVPNGLLNATHEGTLKCVVPIDLTECEWLVCTQRGIASQCIWSLRILGWPVCPSIVGRVWLLIASLSLIVSLVSGSVIPGLPLFIIRGKLVWDGFVVQTLVPME